MTVNRHLKEISEIRDFLNKIDLIGQPEEDLINFVRLSPEETGLDYSIMVDNSKSYIEYNHPLWLYVQLNEDNYAIITIGKEPQIIQGRIDNYELSKIISFIQYNYQTLKDFADKKLLGRVFYRKLIKYEYPISMVMEMANLPKEESGLPCEVWIDDTNTWKKTEHGPRIKYKYNPKEPDKYGTITLHDMKVVNVPEPFLSSKITKIIIKWVEINKTLLEQIANGTITYCKFLENFIPFDKKGNPIEQQYEPCGRTKYGYTMVILNGQYNFINSKNELISPNQWFDKAEDFGVSPNHEFYAVVYIGNVRYCLFKDGEIKRELKS